jgi:hypothetical protein
MPNELVKLSASSVPATVASPELPALVERSGGAARFAWDEYFYAEHHNPHTQKAYMTAVRRFLAWAEGQGVELAAMGTKGDIALLRVNKALFPLFYVYVPLFYVP